MPSGRVPGYGPLRRVSDDVPPQGQVEVKTSFPGNSYEPSPIDVHLGLRWRRCYVVRTHTRKILRDWQIVIVRAAQ
jgi:hypothetical protein